MILADALPLALNTIVLFCICFPSLQTNLTFQSNCSKILIANNQLLIVKIK